jgi:hypothetical protein
VAIVWGVDAVALGPRDDLGYRRPPVTVSFEDLRRRGLPAVVFVHSFLLEGVTACDVGAFAAMIAEAYHTPGMLLVNPPEEDGSQLVRGFAGNGLWEWGAVTPGRRSGWQLTLAPERDGWREATVSARRLEPGGRAVTGPVLVTFPVAARPPGRSPVLADPPDGIMQYRRPPATASFADLRRRGLPEVLFVNPWLPEGVTACGIDAFAAMVEDAYLQGPGALKMDPDLDSDGNEQCLGIGVSGTWEWHVARPARPHNGLLYASAREAIYRMVIAPERDGTRECTLVLGPAGHSAADDGPVAFTIRTVPAAPTGDATAAEPANGEPAAAQGLARLLAFLEPEALPLGLLLAEEPAVELPGPEAAALIGPLLGDRGAAGDVVTALRRAALLVPTGGGRDALDPAARSAIRAGLTAEEAGHWRRAAAAVVAAALPADPRLPASWPACAALLPHARAVLELTSDGMARVARYLGASGDYRAARELCREIAVACAADEGPGAAWPPRTAEAPRAAEPPPAAGQPRFSQARPPADRRGSAAWRAAARPPADRPAMAPRRAAAYRSPDERRELMGRTLVARRELAHWTGMAGDAAAARDQCAELVPATETILGPKHPATLAVRLELAQWTGETGDAAGARSLCVGLWPVAEWILGPEHPDALAVRCELARWTREAGDGPAARDQCAALLPLLERVLGARHADVELTLREFPGVAGLEDAGASARYQASILQRIYERALGGDHPDSLALWGSQVSWAGDAGHPDYGRNHSQALLQRRERILGPEHPDTLLTRHELARFTGLAGDAAGARDLLAALLPVTERVLGPEHPCAMSVRDDLARWTEAAAG